MQIAQPHRNRKHLALAAAVALIGTSVAGAQSTLRVAADAFATIQDAVDAAQSGDTILIEPGAYRGLGNRDVNLGSKELTLCSESGSASVLIDAEGTVALPFRGILIEGGQTSATVIDGLTFTGGATLEGAVDDPFNGGAIRMINTSPIIRNCVFQGNSAGCWGGAVFSGHGGTPLIENCVFRDNFSADGGGGFFSWAGSAPTLRNTLFIGNDGVTQGGGVLHFSTAPITVEGCTFTRNSSNFAAGFAIYNGAIRNSIVWGNFSIDQTWGSQSTTTVAFSNFENPLPYPEWNLGGNISAAPRFKNDGFHLGRFSPCIDAGDPATRAAGQVDVDGRARVTAGRIDMGVDEFRAVSRTRSPL